MIKKKNKEEEENVFTKDRHAVRIAVACWILSNMRSNFQEAGRGGGSAVRPEDEDGEEKSTMTEMMMTTKQTETATRCIEKIMYNHLKLSSHDFSFSFHVKLDSFQHALLCLSVRDISVSLFPLFLLFSLSLAYNNKYQCTQPPMHTHIHKQYACDAKNSTAKLPVASLLSSCRRMFSNIAPENKKANQAKWNASVLSFLNERIDSIMKEDCMTKEGNACIQRSLQSVICMSSVSPGFFDVEIFNLIVQRLSNMSSSSSSSSFSNEDIDDECCSGDSCSRSTYVREIENAWYLLDIARHFVLENNNVSQLLQRSSSSTSPSIIDKLIVLAEQHDKQGHSMICMFIWQLIGVLSLGYDSSSNSSANDNNNTLNTKLHDLC